MRKFIAPTIVLISLFVLSACGSTPQREAYSGVDKVGEIDPSQLIGSWSISVLNPVGEENNSTITQSFKQDGTWESIVVPPAEQTAQLGPLQYKGSGSWQVNGDSVVSQLDSLEETTGNKFGGLMQAMVSAFMPKSSAANVYEMTQSRIIFVHENTGQATLLKRI